MNGIKEWNYNLRELMNSNKTGLEKMDILSEYKSLIEKHISNDIPLIFTLDYPFSTNIQNNTFNNQWKEVNLAIQILEFTKKGNRKYDLKLTKRLNTKYFLRFFRNYIGTSTYDLIHKYHIGYQKNKEKYIKVFIIGANKLFNYKLIDKVVLNKFLEFLEEISKTDNIINIDNIIESNEE